MEAYLVLVVIALVAVLVYFATGVAVRYRHGIRTFPEIIPNYLFWRWVIFSIYDGIMFVFTCGRHRPIRDTRAGGVSSRLGGGAAFETVPADEDAADGNGPVV